MGCTFGVQALMLSLQEWQRAMFVHEDSPWVRKDEHGERFALRTFAQIEGYTKTSNNHKKDCIVGPRVAGLVGDGTPQVNRKRAVNLMAELEAAAMTVSHWLGGWMDLHTNCAVTSYRIVDVVVVHHM